MYQMTQIYKLTESVTLTCNMMSLHYDVGELHVPPGSDRRLPARVT